MGTIQNSSYISQYNGDPIDDALGKALNPDTAPTAGSTNLITSGGVYNGLQRKSNPNLLDNWYFVGGGSQQGGGQFPINQRGQTSYTGIGYGIDRWVMDGPSDAVEISSDKITVSASTQYCGLIQKKELASLQDGLTYTLSILTSSGLYWKTFTLSQAGCQFPIGWFGVDGLYSYIGVIDGVWRVYLVDNADGISHSVSIKAAKLELGDTQTLAHQENGVWVLNDPPPNWQDEYIRCITSTADASDTYANKPIPASGFAPAGFGLGQRAVALADTKDATKPGWYEFSPQTTGVEELFMPYGIIRVDSLLYPNGSPVHIHQSAYFWYGYPDGNIEQRRYWMVNDAVWSPWEYVNPPLRPGIEYRTTERFNGKPVYVKYIEFGSAGNADASVSTGYRTGIANISTIVSVTGWVSNGMVQYMVPSKSRAAAGATEWSSDAWFATDYCYIRLTSGFNNSYSFYAILKYTKTTD